MNHLTFDLTISYNQSTNSHTQRTNSDIQRTYLVFNQSTAHLISRLAGDPVDP